MSCLAYPAIECFLLKQGSKLSLSFCFEAMAEREPRHNPLEQGLWRGKGIGKRDPDALLLEGGKGKKGRGKRDWSPPCEANRHHLPVYGPAPVPDEDGLENVLVHVGTMSGNWLWSGIVREDELAISLEDRVRRALCPDTPVLQRFELAYQWGKKGPWPSGTLRGGHMTVGMSVRDIIGVRRSDDRQVWITGVFLPRDDNAHRPLDTYTSDNSLKPI